VVVIFFPCHFLFSKSSLRGDTSDNILLSPNLDLVCLYVA
jgi:hypothetical protein